MLLSAGPHCQRSLAGHSLQSHEKLDTTQVTLRACTQDFFACGSSAPVRLEPEGGAAAWLVRSLVPPSVQGHGLPLPQELWPIRVFLKPLAAGDQKASLASLSP